MKRNLAILLVLVLLIGVFAGCGEKEEAKQGAEVRITAIALCSGNGYVFACKLG